MVLTKPDEVPFLSRQEIEAKARDVRRAPPIGNYPGRSRGPGQSPWNESLQRQVFRRQPCWDDRQTGDTLTLLVNQADPPYRKRFTIAHELGHHFLHLMSDGEFVDGEANLFRMPQEDAKELTPDRRQEIQANMFAAALLMPEEHIRSEWPRLRSIDEMAQLFNVSESAMGIRIDQLGLE